jgi:methionyl-tRNA formyltransferase
MGADLLVRIIPPYLSGDVQPKPQDPSKVTYAPLLRKQDGELDFHQTAERLARKIRAYSPWPGTFIFWNDSRLIIHQGRSVHVTSPGCGVFTTHEGFPAIGTAEGLLVLEILQLAGKNKLSGEDFLRGSPTWTGS